MEFTSFRIVFISPDYLEKLHNADSEVFYSSDTDYSKKPHLGILTSCNGRKYVIPLTSAKPKHATWRDITATNYRIYEEIDIRTAKIDQYDIIVDETDSNKLREKGIPDEEFQYYKKRILSMIMGESIVLTIISGIIGSILGVLAVFILFKVNGDNMTLIFNINIFIKAFCTNLFYHLAGTDDFAQLLGLKNKTLDALNGSSIKKLL